MIGWLEHNWYSLASNYADNTLAASLFEDIKTHYSSKKRHYHNLSHLYKMLQQLEDYATEIKDLDSLKFSIWYHDIIYKSTNKDNEEQSALFAEKALTTTTFNHEKILNVKKLILSTKKHELIITENTDNAYLLDLDLSILGTDWNIYQQYIKNIRKEYKIYPNFMYNPGRKKVLKHFLERDTLYFTNVFKLKFEKQARENLKREIDIL